ARSTACLSNQRQVFTCIVMFVNDHKGLPPGSDNRDTAGVLIAAGPPKGTGIGQLVAFRDTLADSALPDSSLVSQKYLRSREVFRCPETDLNRAIGSATTGSDRG